MHVGDPLDVLAVKRVDQGQHLRIDYSMMYFVICLHYSISHCNTICYTCNCCVRFDRFAFRVVHRFDLT